MPNNKDNQHCLNCASFQPYENANPVETANGECRYQPHGDTAGDFGGSFREVWPYIEDADIFWCAKWKITPLPAITQTGVQSPAFIADWTDFHADPWNRREALDQSCWGCNNYQHSDPEIWDLGECRYNPTPNVIQESIGVLPLLLQSRKYVYRGDKFCCSCWERNFGTVPPIPPPIAKSKLPLDLQERGFLPPEKSEAKDSEKKPVKKS